MATIDEAWTGTKIAIALMLTVAACVVGVVFGVTGASRLWGSHSPVVLDDRRVKAQLLYQTEQQCLASHGNWSTPNGQEGRCVFK